MLFLHFPISTYTDVSLIMRPKARTQEPLLLETDYMQLDYEASTLTKARSQEPGLLEKDFSLFFRSPSFPKTRSQESVLLEKDYSLGVRFLALLRERSNEPYRLYEDPLFVFLSFRTYYLKLFS